MGIFGHLFAHDQNDTPELLPAIDRAVVGVEPLLKQTHSYPEAFRKPVITALEYTHKLAFSMPGPVAVDLDSYARDAYVHAIFPSMELVPEAIRSSRAMQDYLREHPATDEVYALMGMRRREKSLMGMELSGDVIQRDVPQHVVYFTSHTIENPAPSEEQAREQVAWSLFDRLVNKVAKRIALRKQKMQAKVQEKDLLMARIHAANEQARPALEAELSGRLSELQTITRTLELHRYTHDFEAVLLNPEQHLRLNPTPMLLDSMGIRRNNEGSAQGTSIIFNDLIGFDRRDWTVTLVHCRAIQSETFATQLETAYRKLCV